jgi:signal transduction histidine kinase
VPTRTLATSNIADRLCVATSAAVAIGFVLLLLPANARDPAELWLAAGFGVALIAFSRWSPVSATTMHLVVAVGYLLFAAMLRDAAGGAASGFAGFYLIPIIWLALTARKRELLAGLSAMFLALGVPLVVASANYPSSGLRGAAVLLSVGVTVGFLIQHLLGQTREAATLARAQAADLEQATNLLADQNQRLLELDRMKDDFIGVVSHELRTPLTSISGFLEIVLEDSTKLAPDHQQFLATVSRNVDRLSLLVDDLLFLAGTDVGALKLDKQDVEVAELLRQAEESARPRAQLKNITLNIDHEELPGLEGDRARLAQLVDNLVSNAIKFTPDGGHVTLRAGTSNGHIAIDVEDSGIGIPAEEISLLFGRFYRASTATDNRIEGTGLGLAISQTIANAHGGRIDVSSERGRGTTFRVLLPVGDSGRTQSPRLAAGADTTGADAFRPSSASRTAQEPSAVAM